MLKSTFCLFLIVHVQYLPCGASPMYGKGVRRAETNEFPFLVSLSHNNSKNIVHEKYTHFCGGTLITNQHVLTAAHCFHDKKNYNDIVVKVGSYDLKNSRIYEVRWGVTYGEWLENEIPDDQRGGRTHDIAILKLVKSVCASIKLPTITKIPDNQLYGKSVVTAGWGLIENDKRPRYMNVAKLIVLRPAECAFSLLDIKQEAKDFAAKIYLCTQTKPPVHLGCGDSGGPLLINNSEIIGVNFADCALDEDSEYQNLHLSVNYYRKFIESVKKL